VYFENSSYVINKLAPPPTIILQLSKPLTTDVTVRVTDKEGTATSE